MPWCINTGKSLIPLTLLFLHQKRNLLIPLELSRVMHQGSERLEPGTAGAPSQLDTTRSLEENSWPDTIPIASSSRVEVELMASISPMS